MLRASRTGIPMRAAAAACLCVALVGAACAPARVSLRPPVPLVAAKPTPGPDAAQAPQAERVSADPAMATESGSAAGTDGSARDASAHDPGEAGASPVTAQDESAPAAEGDAREARASDANGDQATTEPTVAAAAGAGDGAESADASEDGSASLGGQEPPSWSADTSEAAPEPTARQSMGGSGLGRAALEVPAPAMVPVLSGALDGLLPDEDLTDYGLVLEDLSTGARIGINGSQTFPSASLYKLGVAWIALRRVDAGVLSLDAPIMIEDTDTVEPEPYGGFGEGDTPTLRDALAAMLSISSNAAAHALLRMIGRDVFADEMDRLGMTQTRVPDDGLATTSADDMAHLLRLIATSPELSAASRELIAQDMA